MSISEKERQIIHNSNKYTFVKQDTIKRKYMTVREMGNLLGLKKTERYYLVHKNYFETKRFYNGKMLVDLNSFEEWYARQLHYKKVGGEEPGSKLKQLLFSPEDIGRMLGITQCTVYDILIRYDIKTVLIDNHKLIPKECFWEWYNNQSRYRTNEDREKDRLIEDVTISMPEMARLLGVERSKIYYLLSSRKYKDYFEIVIVAKQKRITKRSFDRFLTAQDEYQVVTSEKEKAECKRKIKKITCNPNYLTLTEAASVAGVSRARISECYAAREFPVITIGRNIFIKRNEFENWLQTRNTKR